jgi:hypothetical protein
MVPRDSAGEPLGAIAFDDVDLAIEWLDSDASAWQPITLAAGAVGVWSTGGWVHVGDGVHQLGLPNAAITPGDRTVIRLTYDAHPQQFDAVDAVIADVVDEAAAAAIAAAVAAELAAVVLRVETAAVTAGGNLVVDAGDDYTGGGAIRIEIDTAEDLTDHNLILAMRRGDDAYAYRIAIEGAAPDHYADFDPAASVTGTWDPGTYELRYRLEDPDDKIRTIGRARMTVRPFETPTPIVDLPIVPPVE